MALKNSMRKIYLYGLLCLGLAGIISCSGNKEKRVQTFAETFSGYVNANQLDSIKAVYPTANFDSISPLTTDSIQISETDGIYRIDFGSNKWVEAKENEDGTFTIENSKGIAAFPQDKYYLALNTGMLNNSTADTKAQELMNDTTYFIWLNKKVTESMQNILSLNYGKPKFHQPRYTEAITGTLVCTVTNNSEKEIKGDDYSISYRQEAENCSDGSVPNSLIKRNKKGVDVAPGQSVEITLTHSNCVGFKNLSIDFNNSGDYTHYKPTGKEYQEYLDFKK